MREYEVYIAGLRHTVQCSEAEADRQGLKPVEHKAAPKPKNKSRKPRNK